eukprot:7571201-Lingulodinium_polyedra.AAC.1
MLTTRLPAARHAQPAKDDLPSPPPNVGFRVQWPTAIVYRFARRVSCTMFGDRFNVCKCVGNGLWCSGLHAWLACKVTVMVGGSVVA